MAPTENDGTRFAENEALAGLNEEQAAAVTHGEGPLLIVAGAGTGKTQVLTRRIAWLIATGKARPEQILALTFTEKAASEMESRVDQLVAFGSTGATVSTFHAFCDRLVREHAVELGLTGRLRVEQHAEVLVFLREHLFELGLKRYLPLGQPDAHLSALVRVFDRARDEDVTPEAYRAHAEALLAAAGSDAALIDAAEAELEKASAYAAYQKLMLESGRVDFGAQIALALRLLRERPHLLREIQDRFRWLLVDEFQDTNHVQYELVRHLAGARSNLTVVGDDDQSIYRFRGAKVENIRQYQRDFPRTKIVLLRSNYRSGQQVLDVAHRLIQFNNPARFEATDPELYNKRLIAARTEPAEVAHVAFATGSEEADAVAREIAERVGSGAAPAGAHAVIARTHDQLEPVALSLRAAGVRFQRRNARGLYTRPEVLLALHALRSVADPDDGPAAFGLLGDPLFGVDAVALARLSAQASRHHRSLLRVAAEAASDSAAELDPASRSAIERLQALHRRLCEEATRRTTAEVLYLFLSESGWLEQLTHEDSPDHVEKVQNLARLFGIVQRVGPLLQSDRVAFFMRHLDLLIAAGDDPQAASGEPDDDAVQLLTAHNAKGLEFRFVYVIQLVEERFPLRHRTDSLTFPLALTHHADDPRLDHEREERRLFYVALTRARDRLVLTHAEDYGGRRTKKYSRFLVEALGLPEPPRARATASSEEALARFAPTAHAVAPEVVPLAADAPLTLSHSQIDDYLTCPLRYRFAHVISVPLPVEPARMYGIAVHHAIRVFHQHQMRGHPISADDVVAVLDEQWADEGFISPEHNRRLREQGHEALRRFVAEQSDSRPPLAIERDFRFTIGPDTVIGRWDRIDETSEGIILTDYKTNPVDDPEKARERAMESARDAQLGLYALAYRETSRDHVVPAEVRLHFVVSGLIGRAAVRPAHLDKALARVAEASAGIRRAVFPPTPDPRTCGYCPYQRLCRYSAARG